MSEREESDRQTQKRDHIDERKQGEEAQKESEEHFKLITDNIVDEIWLMDMDMNVTYITPSVYRYRGFSLEDMQKMDWTEHLTPESLEVAIKALELALTPENFSQKDFEVTGTQDLEFYCKDGSTVWSETTIKLLRNENGEPIGLLGVAHDITDRKQAENALRESENRLKIIFESAPDAYYLNDFEGTFLDGNKAAEELLGYSREELIGKNFVDAGILPMDQAEKALNLLADSINGTPTGPDEFILNRKDGTKVNVEILTHPVKIGGEDRVLGIARDITERKKAEELQSVLLDIANSINTCENLDELYPIIHRNLSQIIDTTNFFIALYNKDSHTLSFPYYIDEKDEYEVVSAEKTNCHYIVRTGEALLADREIFADLNARGEIVTREDLSRPLIWLGAPLKRGDEVFGVVAVQSYTDPQAYDENDKEILQLISHQIANAIDEVKAEEALKESEEKFRNFFEHSKDVVFMTDKGGNITNINMAGCFLFDHSPEEMVGMNVYDFYADPEDRTLLMELIEDKGGIEQFEVQLLRKDRTIIDCLLTCSVKLDHDGMIGYNGVIHDITRFRQVENERNRALGETLRANLELRDSEEKYRTLFMTAPEGITVVGLDGSILDCNDRAGEIGGRTKGEVIGKNFLELGVFDEENADGAMELFRKRLNGEEVGPVELPITVKGERKWIDVFHAPLYRDGEIYALYIISRDVTERKQAEEKSKAEHRRAEFYNDLMAHDINNLNQGAMSNLELLLMSAELSEKGRKYAKGAFGQVAGSANLISNLKKISELEQKDGKTVNMDITLVLQEAIDHIHSLFPGRHVEIRHNLSEKKCLVKGNELLFDVFSNLLNNAVKFDRHDDVIVDVHVSETDDDHLKMEFKDRGPGIEDNSKEAIFDRLKRKDETIQGSGLGLTLVKYIINNIGGRVWVEDRMKDYRAQGSNFVLLIPRGD